MARNPSLGRGEILWDDLRVLLAVQEAGSFFGAAKQLGISTSTVARRVETLERRVGKKLVRRTTDGALIEPAAARLLSTATRTRDELAIAVRDDGLTEFHGVIRLSLGSGFVPTVAATIALFRSTHPETTFELIVDNRPADLTKREADLGLRTTNVDGEGVIMRRAGRLAYGLFASAGYIASSGRDAASIDRHCFVGYEGPLDRDVVMRWLYAHGARRFSARVSSTDALVALACAGQGVAVLPLVIAAQHDGLLQVDCPLEIPSKNVYVALHRDVRQVPRIRAFADVMTRALMTVLA